MNTSIKISIFIFIITLTSMFIHDIMFNKNDKKKLDIKKMLIEKVLLSLFVSTCTYIVYPYISNDKTVNHSELHTESFES